MWILLKKCYIFFLITSNFFLFFCERSRLGKESFFRIVYRLLCMNRYLISMKAMSSSLTFLISELFLAKTISSGFNDESASANLCIYDDNFHLFDFQRKLKAKTQNFSRDLERLKTQSCWEKKILIATPKAWKAIHLLSFFNVIFMTHTFLLLTVRPWKIIQIATWRNINLKRDAIIFNYLYLFERRYEYRWVLLDDAWMSAFI